MDGDAVVCCIVLATCSAVASAAAAVAYSKGLLSFIFPQDGGAPGPGGRPLPVPDLRMNVAPWYIRDIRNRDLLSVETSTGGGNVLRYNYKKGLAGGPSGAAIYANPLRMFPADSATLSFSVYFPPDFEFVRAGKLLGLSIGQKPGDHASGGEWSPTSGSMRFMWRQPEGDRAAVVGYLYFAVAGGASKAFAKQGPATQGVLEAEDPSGHNIWYHKGGGMFVRKGQWNALSVTVVLNTPGKADGVLKMTVNGVSRQVNDMVYRESASVRINETFLASIFGGNSAAKFASPKDTFSLVRDFRIVAS